MPRLRESVRGTRGNTCQRRRSIFEALSAFGERRDDNDDDDEAAVTDEDMTLKTIDCIAGVPWNAVCRRTMAVFVKYLTDNYNDELVNEQGFDGDVIESCLSHIHKNEVRNAYNRTDYLKRRQEVMSWWSDLISKASKGSGSIGDLHALQNRK